MIASPGSLAERKLPGRFSRLDRYRSRDELTGFGSIFTARLR